jgi:hypothetical protein
VKQAVAPLNITSGSAPEVPVQAVGPPTIGELSRLKPAYFSIYLHIKRKTPENRAYLFSIFGIMERLQEITENKRLRKELDEKIQEVKNLPPSRERSLAITKLQEAVMWLGMDLKRLNDTNPYPSSKDPSTGDKIEPTADGLKL